MIANLVERKYNQGKVLTFTGPLAPRYSDMTSHAFFVPFMSRIIEYAASDLTQYDLQLYTDYQITRSLNYEGSLNNYFTVIKPDNSPLAVTPEDVGGALLLKIDQADIPGIYTISLSGREIDRFALNVDPVECDLTYLDADRMADALRVKNLNQIENKVSIETVLAEFRFGRELWSIFLWVAVFLIIVEILLSRSSPPEEE